MDGGTNPGLPGTGGGTMLRLYAAFSLPSHAARPLHDWSCRIAGSDEALHVVDAHDLHVTYAFLGDVVEDYVPAVAAALDSVAFSIPGPTGMRIDGVDRFGGGRVLGIDVHVELHAVLDTARDRFLASIAPYVPMADHRAWRPHCSLLRARGATELPDRDAIAAVQLERLEWIVPDLRLYASLPGPSGTLHRCLHAVPLGEPVLRD